MSDGKIQHIEVDFAIPVDLTDEQSGRLQDLVQEIAEANTPLGHVHWLCSGGYKPLWSKADLRIFPDLAGGRSGLATGEPDFDESTLHFATACREE